MSVHGVFASAKDTRDLAAGSVVFEAGSTGAEMFGVISGRIELRDGDVVVGSVEAGDTFGELAIIDKAPRSLTAVASEDSVVAVIDERTFLYLVHETPMFALQVMRSLSARIRAHDQQ